MVHIRVLFSIRSFRSILTKKRCTISPPVHINPSHAYPSLHPSISPSTKAISNQQPTILSITNLKVDVLLFNHPSNQPISSRPPPQTPIEEKKKNPSMTRGSKSKIHTQKKETKKGDMKNLVMVSAQLAEPRKRSRCLAIKNAPRPPEVSREK